MSQSKEEELSQQDIDDFLNMQKPCVVNVKSESCDVFIGRPTIWGNPFKIGRDGTRDEVVRKYSEWIVKKPELINRAKRKLKGKILGCYCSPLACHGDILLEIVNSE